MGLAELGGYLQQTLALIGLLALGLHIIRPFLSHSGYRRNGTHGSSVSGAEENTDVRAIVRRFDSKDLNQPGATSAEPETRKTFQKDDYTIGLVTALSREFRAAIATLDERHNPPSDFSERPDDINHYAWGRMAKHNVVVVTLPKGKPGTTSASHVATLMVSAMPSIRFGLMVGIGGGVPFVDGKGTDVRLGDVVVSASSGAGTTGGVVQYDFGKEETGGTRRSGSLNGPPAVLLSAVSSFEAEVETSTLLAAIGEASACIRRKFGTRSYAYQGSYEDTLFKAWYNGSGPLWWIFGFLPVRLLRDLAIVKREDREMPEAPKVHYGLIASGNKVIKNAGIRDEMTAWLKQNTSGGECLCFEMEAAGLMDNFPCLVIRGISDYADSHKNDKWQDYAALTAAAYARVLLEVLKPVQVYSSREASEIIGVIREVRQDLQDMKAGIRLMSEEDLDRSIRKWLRLSDQPAYLKQAIEARNYHTETNTWFFEHTTYIDWLSRKPSHLWLYGASGCGKTVLSSTIIGRLGQNGFCVYFFFDFRKEYTFVDALSSLIWQLYSTPQGPKGPLRRLYSSKQPLLPSTESLEETFDQMVQQTDQVQIVFDALDECGEKEKERLLKWLYDHIGYVQTRNNKLRIIMTSRSDQKDIINWLSSSDLELGRLSLDQATAGVTADISKYIRTRLAGDRAFGSWRNDGKQFPLDQHTTGLRRDFGFQESGYGERSEAIKPTRDSEEKPILQVIEERLTAEAGTMFRWVSLQLDTIGKLASVSAIKQALATLPKGLHETYDRSLNGVPDEHKTDALRILQFLLFCSHPLTIEELLDTTSVNLEAPPGRSIDPGARMIDLKPLSSLMPSLIKESVRDQLYRRRGLRDRTPVDAKSPNARTSLQIAHSSVRDYLVTARQMPVTQPILDVVSSKANIVAVCLAYLGTTIATVSREDDLTSFAQFSILGWISLAKEVEEAASDSILKFLIFNGSKMHERPLAWYKLYGCPPLFAACALRLDNTVERLLREGHRNHGAVVQMLVENGLDVDVNARTRYGTALYAATEVGSEKIVQMLLDHGAEE